LGEYEFDVNDSAVITAEMSNGAIGVIHTTRYATGYDGCMFSFRRNREAC